jgi:hypothetical protein
MPLVCQNCSVGKRDDPEPKRASEPNMITEEKPVVEETANTLVPYGTDQRLTTPHCEWCASQGLGHDDDDIFDAHFKTIVAAMRRHEGKIVHGPTAIVASRGGDRMNGMLEVEPSESVKPFNFSLTAFTRWGAAQSVLALISFAVVVVSAAGTKSIDSATFAPLSKDSFSTSTGSIKIKVDKTGATVTGIGSQQHMPAVFWHGGWQDEFDLLQGKFDRCNWLKLDNNQLATADGMVLYNSHAPEIKTVTSMRKFRDSVYRYYSAFGKYPQSAQDLCQDDSYINAISHDREVYDIKQVVNGAIVSSDNRTTVNDAHSSDVAAKANTKRPGSIWAVGVKSDPIIADDANSYNWRNHSFYIYAADSKGMPVKGGVVGKDFTIALKNGADVSELQTASLNTANARVGFYTGNKPEVANIRWRYSFLGFTLMLLAVTTIMRLVHSHAGDAQLARLKKGRK